MHAPHIYVKYDVCACHIINTYEIIEKQKYQTVNTIPISKTKIPNCQYNSNIKNTNRKKRQNGFPKIQINDRTLSWFVTGTSIKSGGLKLVLWI
jgi:hypothetical protein